MNEVMFAKLFWRIMNNPKVLRNNYCKNQFAFTVKLKASNSWGWKGHYVSLKHNLDKN